MMELTATTEASKKIKAISKETIHQICSGQVVFDLATAVKELVENSLDSGATTVDVKLSDYGKTFISVSDNGCGIVEEDFESLALKHHTSKLRDFSDLPEVNTFGFRGEALSSLCSLSDLSIVTRHSTYEHAYKLQFDNNGSLTRKEACARESGTTVHVRNIFKNLPVRAKELERTVKKEFTKTVQILYSYCLVATSVKITCNNAIAGKSSNLVVATMGAKSILENVNSVFGKKASEGLLRIDLQPPDAVTLEEFYLPSDSSLDFTWEFFVSSCVHTLGRSSPDRQFFYVNGRPCDINKLSKLVNNIYHKYNNKQYPFVFLHLKLNQHSTDVNVTPDKRTIFFSQESLILASIKSNLVRTWEKVQGSFTPVTLDELNFSFKRNISSTSSSEPPAKKQQISQVTENVRKKEEKEEDKVSTKSTKHFKKSVVTMSVTMNSIKQALLERRQMASMHKNGERRTKYRVQIEPNRNSDAEKELQKELTKDSFNQMEIIGQFNLGFIVTLLEGDLFIVDQHASDEKFQFEKLNRETKLQTQKLIAPKLLNLASINETILIDNIRIFEDNGFMFNVNAQGEQGHRVELTGMPVSRGWQFDQQDIDELIFLIKEGDTNNLNADTKVLRPSRVRQMLASRACRSAVMIGTALNVVEMQRLIMQMSQMQNPWNCPHGRPTIRHLLCMSLLK